MSVRVLKKMHWLTCWTLIGVMLLSKIKKLNIINGCNYAEEVIRGYLCLCLVVVKQSKINQIKINLHLGKGVDQMKSL